MPQAYFTFAKQIFHIEDISLVPEERISLKKALAIASAFFLAKGYKKDVFVYLLYGFELSHN